MSDAAADLPSDVARVVRTWSPDSLSRLERGRTQARTVAVLAAPGLDQESVGAVVTSAGWSVRPVSAASAVLVLVDPDLPPGGALVRAARSIPAELPVVLRIAAGPDDARRVLARWTVSVPRPDAVVVSGPDDGAVVDALDRAADEWDPTDAALSAVERALSEARSALTAAARRDTGSADLTDARERRRRAASIPTDDGLLLRRSTAEVRLDLAHRVGVHRRETGTRVAAAVGDASFADLRRLPSVVAAEIGAASGRLSDEVTTALTALGAPGSAPPVERVSTTHQPPPSARWGVDDVLTGVVGASAGAGVGRVAVWAASLGGASAVVVTVLCAVVMAAAVVRTRLLSTRRARVRRWAADVVADAASGWERDTASRLVMADSWLTVRLSAQVRDASARRNAVIAEIDGEIRDITSRAASRAAAYQRDLEVLDRVAPTLGRRGTVPSAGASKHEVSTTSRNTGD
ncbi:hypothetical protein HQ325_12160 [Rhodococcus sp. BP-349]|uniref:hypothetical protein n=1 Tax=unclassified Rhodococcus (in: high G+C Gram-positive bacteria) TaxID=192944 RepID=UPI001C9AE567|nr:MULTISPECIES: hypothetical protein [unclassified Rhodococcus (in: high G+C Gram-positive bacteria)]MBY6539428.1 hypothetical protein [Rhodococcus sp. BP-363]MBY6544244.1 hypothetical protein [Rhodococcus sp. BP-369]MBY6563474.1 hypothetical protein [Rhodococcus sp. BP-370]MBY6577766.1 hypothetical protein [Rhodococcus sp. BP-364]MBY6587067.1 hypothetical protein [Rhodococcus sp. BP-358]